MQEALLCKNWQNARQKTILATIITKGHLTLMETKRKKQKHSKYFWLLTTDVSANDIIVFYDTLVTKELQYTGTNGNIWYVLRLVNSKVIFFSRRFLSFKKISYFWKAFFLMWRYLWRRYLLGRYLWRRFRLRIFFPKEHLSRRFHSRRSLSRRFFLQRFIFRRLHTIFFLGGKIY